MRFPVWACPFVLLIALAVVSSNIAHARDVFDRDNLVAWCIVPFDSARRGPEERARMLADLGIRQLAYDWRDEHIQQWDEEVEAMDRHGVRIVAWWMAPVDLNETNRKILDVVRRHRLKLQFWVLIPDPGSAETPQTEKVRSAAAAIRPLVVEAARLGCQVGLYNHGGWFGEPENQIAILKELTAGDGPEKLDNVGLVYNLHHGHSHLDRFSSLLDQIKPWLFALNLNGMTRRGDEARKKILPLGAGELDLEVLRTIRDSGYRGPIGILNHTDLDARARLADNLAGLDWLVKQLRGEPVGPLPKMQTYSAEPLDPAAKKTPLAGQSSAQRAQLAELIAAAQSGGDAKNGALVFASPKFACLSCHRVGGQGGAIGPELTKIGHSACPEEIAESLLWPKRKVKPEFVASAIATDTGSVHQGYIIRESDDTLTIREAASGQVITLRLSEIAERQQLGTLMPDGLSDAMTPVERRDVMRFLMELGRDPATTGDDALAAAHLPATFAYDKGPLVPAQWRYAGHAVNRERLYDFYAKEADHFRDLGRPVAVLPAYPGLDGGHLGHWGNQNEDTWRDDRWNRMDCGSVMCGVVQLGRKMISRGICVRLGDRGELVTCFNPDTSRYEAVWQGGFVKFSPVRHGFVDPLTIGGETMRFTAAEPPAGTCRYRGYYRHGPRILFALEIDGKPYLDAPAIEDGRFVRTLAPRDEHPLRHLTCGGPAQWPQVLETRGRLGGNGAYTIDSITPPTDNPWNALMFFGGHDFLADGSAMLCTMQGDVWHVTGLDRGLEHVRWKRFAAGLHHPLGLVVVDGQVYVLGRNQITRLHDLNHDDEADFYECFSQAFVTSAAGHDFVCGLERDSAGNFYTVSGPQGLLRISPDGAQAEVLATGFRNPDGLGLLPDGSITVPSSEGEWTPASMINLMPPANMASGQQPCTETPPHYGYRGPQGHRPPELPLAYLPRGLDNSSAGQIFVNSKKWGPLKNQVIHFSYGAGTYFLVLRDEVDGRAQAAVVPLVGDFASGPHRGRFHPLDGQLYVTGMGGWGTYTAEDGAFERVRYAGGRVQLPVAFHVHNNGVHITFAEPVDPSVAGETARQFAQAWNYRYSGGYGSEEYAPSHYGLVGHDRVAIAGSHVLPDGRSLFVEMPELQPVNQLHLRLELDAHVPLEMFVTVHALDNPFTDFPDYRAVEKTIAPHPILQDLALLANPPPPNPWRERIAGARAVTVEAGQNLSFATRSFTVRAGEPIKLTFTNPDVVPHNWVLLKPGALLRVGEQVNRLVADPEAVTRHYVPRTDDVLAYTDIVPAGGKFSINFQAPQTRGRYPYLCSFPGHWMVMNGQLIVE
jgi:putative heme-binding domain-containing protein